MCIDIGYESLIKQSIMGYQQLKLLWALRHKFQLLLLYQGQYQSDCLKIHDIVLPLQVFAKAFKFLLFANTLLPLAIFSVVEIKIM